MSIDYASIEQFWALADLKQSILMDVKDLSSILGATIGEKEDRLPKTQGQLQYAKLVLAKLDTYLEELSKKCINTVRPVDIP